MSERRGGKSPTSSTASSSSPRATQGRYKRLHSGTRLRRPGSPTQRRDRVTADPRSTSRSLAWMRSRWRSSGQCSVVVVGELAGGSRSGPRSTTRSPRGSSGPDRTADQGPRKAHTRATDSSPLRGSSPVTRVARPSSLPTYRIRWPPSSIIRWLCGRAHRGRPYRDIRHDHGALDRSHTEGVDRAEPRR